MINLKNSKPFFFENSRIPVLLSYVSPITIGAITLGPVVFSRGEISDRTKRHETIHWQQYIETLVIGFPILYALFWVLGCIKYRSGKMAYAMIPFEQEAYSYDEHEYYLLNRKRYTWTKYKL